MGDEMIYVTPKPKEKVWTNSKLYTIYIMDVRYPICGYRNVWVLIGRKWVRCCEPITWKKFKMKREDWDNITDKKEKMQNETND